MVAEGQQWHCRHRRQTIINYAQWRTTNDSTDNNYNKTTINKCLAAEAEDDNGWQEAGRGGGGRGGMCHVHFFTW
jgi:hypothetical protein